MPIELRQFENVARNPFIPDNAVLRVAQRADGRLEVRHGTSSFFGRSASWIRNPQAPRQDVPSRDGRHQAEPLTQMDMLQSIAHAHGSDVALGVVNQYGVLRDPPGPLTKYRVRQILVSLERVRHPRSFDKLPTEVMWKIMDEFSTKGLFAVQRTNKLFQSAAKVKLAETRHAGGQTELMILGRQKKAVEHASRRPPWKLLGMKKSEARFRDMNKMESERRFREEVAAWLAGNRPAHVNLNLHELEPNLRPIALQCLMNCDHLKQLDLTLIVAPGQRPTALLDDLSMTLPMTCANNEGLEINIHMASGGQRLAPPANISANDMTRLCGLPGVVSLKLTKVWLADDMTTRMGNLQHLRQLTIVDDSVTAQGLRVIAQLPKLESFTLAESMQLIDAEMMQIMGGMHKLRELRLPLDGLNRELVEAFANAVTNGTEPSSLKKLDFSNNLDLTDDAVPALKRLPAMESVNLRGCEIGNQGALDLATATHLGKIDLTNNDIDANVKKQVMELNPDIRA